MESLIGVRDHDVHDGWTADAGGSSLMAQSDDENVLGNNVNDWPPLDGHPDSSQRCFNGIVIQSLLDYDIDDDEDDEDDNNEEANDDDFMYCCLPPKKTKYDVKCNEDDAIVVGSYNKEDNKMMLVSVPEMASTSSSSSHSSSTSNTPTSTADVDSIDQLKSNHPKRCLKLDDITQYDYGERQAIQKQNRTCLIKAKQRHDIKHLDIHYTCIDKRIMDLLIDLLLSSTPPSSSVTSSRNTDDKKHASPTARIWESFTLRGINGLGDLFNYARSTITSLEDLVPLFVALRNVKILNIYSCSQSRGHGLERLLDRKSVV